MKFPKTIHTFFVFTAVFVSLSSCTEIFEPSIARKEVKLLAPANNYFSSNYTVNFWFEPVSDALFYRLQVVSTSFDSINALVLDTLINHNRFEYNIDPGKYEWRIRAENGSSQTIFTEPRSFTINTGTLAEQKVRLLSPSNNSITKQSQITFKWGDVFSAKNYRLQVDDNNFSDEGDLFYNQTSSELQAIVTIPVDQTYKWRVRAENDAFASQWSPLNSIIYDHTPPSNTILKYPDNDQQVLQPVNLEWNPVLSAKSYKLYVYASDSASSYNQSFPMILNKTSYSFNIGNLNERIYWKVSAIDDAGNEGEPSDLRNFIVQE